MVLTWFRESVLKTDKVLRTDAMIASHKFNPFGYRQFSTPRIRPLWKGPYELGSGSSEGGYHGLTRLLLLLFLPGLNLRALKYRHIFGLITDRIVS